ncbi:divergent polysaccharide deacetylase family protein [Candidatus Aerophobetes bacterium]|uniref:Divergent polysaccharide deacetylase family protein n=1 Tax=Aerophobetes bacterium TaxID=2030807 RepID=A0A523S4Q8_UNCAE|nr:MAG: divergent polysaccharide deacetylase family protein [Candidatus Aerophobetes bacterium]
MSKKSSKVFYLLIGMVIGIALCLGGIGGFLRWRTSIYEKEFSRIDAKVEKAIKRLDLPLVEKKIKKMGFLPVYFGVEETLSIPFDYSLDRLISQIEQEFSLPPIKICQIKEENLKDSYEILVNLGLEEERITYTLRFVLKKVKIALIIDDFGYSKSRAVDIFLKDLDIPLTLSIIPGTEYARLIAEEAHKNGKEVMLHLPMEAEHEELNHGYKWIILNEMEEKEIRLATEEAIKNIPHAVGLNNHMGSLITTKERPMKALLEVVKEEGLFFIDSKTDPDSIAFPLAQKMGIKSTSRQVFLDNEKKIDYITKQFQKLISLAKVRGKVIGIGHANITTARAIKEILTSLEGRKIELVYVSEIVE